MPCNSSYGRKIFSSPLDTMGKDQIKNIGNRISILQENNVFSLVILPTDEKRKVTLMMFWLLAWTISGIIVIINYFSLAQVQAKLFVIIWLTFWAYFEFKIIRVYMWKRFGKEKLWIKNGRVHYQQDINGRGKIKQYDLNLVSDLSCIEIKKGSIADTFSQTFWVKGGERLVFNCQSKQVKFGMQLSDDDTLQLFSIMKKQLKL